MPREGGDSMRTRMERVRPEAVGVSPGAILKFLRALEETGFVSHDLMVIRHGKVVFEAHYAPFRPDIPHMLCSCSKSFASAAVGFAIDEGRFALDDPIVGLFPEKLKGTPHPYAAAMTVRHLLEMSTAYADAIQPASEDWTADFLNREPDHYPGTTFGYDSIGTHVLCEAVQKFTGMTVHEYLTPRLFEPLGIAPEEVRWSVGAMGVNHGGGGLCLTPEGMAKFAQLLLSDGVWEGRRVLPEGWVSEATRGRVSAAASDGSYKPSYGRKFWRVQDGGYACLGLAGQAILVHPERDVAFVGTANGFQTDYHYFHTTFFWQYVYKELAEGAIPREDAAYAELLRRTERAEAFLPEGGSESPHIPEIGGKRLTAERNALGATGFEAAFTEGGGEIRVCLPDRTLSVPFGYRRHVAGGIGLHALAKGGASDCPNGCGSAGAWVDGRTLVVQSHMIDTLSYFLVTLHIGERAVVLDLKAFGIYRYEGIPCALTHLRG